VCVESAETSGQKNSTVSDNNTISLSLSEEPALETLKESVDTSAEVNSCL
jgi:hypothetical protein